MNILGIIPYYRIEALATKEITILYTVYCDGSTTCMAAPVQCYTIAS